MPLPKPPAKRADLLSREDFESQSAPTPGKRSRRRPAGEPDAPALLDLSTVSEVGVAASPASARPQSTPALLEARPTSVVTAAAPAPAAASVAPAASSARSDRPRSRPEPAKKPRGDGSTTLFVLDTNVLMHDPTSLFRFEEHDIYLPMITLEELDGHKRGMTEVARNARQVSRDLDALAANMPTRNAAGRAEGIALARTGHREAGGKLFFQTDLIDVSLPAGLPQGKADNQILGVVKALGTQQPGRDVVLVSKDINMRIKARALGLPAEDYFNDKTLDDGDLLYTGALPLPADFWDKLVKTVESWQQGGLTYYRIDGPIVGQLLINQFVFLDTPGAAPFHAKVIEITGRTAVLRTLKDYSHQKNAVWGVMARNPHQNFALNLLLDPECDFITLTGTAGSGKTLMSLAAGLSQVMDDRRYTEIIVTRVTVPVGEDIGFLPGTEEEKMGPWMGALDDNLEVLAKTDSGAGEWGRAATNDLVRSKIKIKSLNFMRGRTFLNKFVIIDEAQNLTPKQMKTLVTRAGPGTKIVCLGNLAQIDTPYLTEGSSGLTYAVDRFKGWAHSGHVTLARGERSRLADFASEVL